jgi:hypothetical protein
VFGVVSLTLYTGQCDRRENASYPVTAEMNRILVEVHRVMELIMFRHIPFLPAATVKLIECTIVINITNPSSIKMSTRKTLKNCKK